MTALAKRAVACKGWKPTGLALLNHHLVWTEDGLPDFDGPYRWLWEGWLMHLVREAHGPDAHLVRLATHDPERPGELRPALWWALTRKGEIIWIEDPETGDDYAMAGPTRMEALVCALEAA